MNSINTPYGHLPVLRNPEEMAEEAIYIACFDLELALAIREVQRELEILNPLYIAA